MIIYSSYDNSYLIIITGSTLSNFNMPPYEYDWASDFRGSSSAIISTNALIMEQLEYDTANETEMYRSR